MAISIDTFTIEGPSPEITADALSKIARQTFIDSFGHLYSSADLEMFLAESHAPANYEALLTDCDTGIWIARETTNSDLIGYLVAGPCHLPVENMPPSSGELMRFYIEKSFQGAGLGKKMLEIALAWLAAHFDHIYLSVYAPNVGAQRLYARYGFAKVQAYHFMVGNHADPEFIFKLKT